MKAAKISCNKVIAEAKRSYWSNYCLNNILQPHDAHKLWGKVKEIHNCVSSPSCPILLEDKEFPTAKEKAEAFADYFASNSSSKNLPESCKLYRYSEEKKDIYIDPQSDNTLFINSDIKEQELLDALKLLPNKQSSPGMDSISNQMLKHLPSKWLNILVKIFNKCWTEGVMPTLWKTSITVPILKMGKPKANVSSYRPIALTSHVAKLMERIILVRFTYFCEKKLVIPKQQAGFRKNRSTIDHLVKLTTHVKKQLAKRQSVLATFFDVSKAYDQVWHARLLCKLKQIGLSGNCYSYFKTFLNGRTIQTRVGRVYSEPRNIDMGIPQGSVIAPLLFNILLYDLPSHLSKYIHFIQYADDIWLNCTIKKKTSFKKIKYYQKIYQHDLTSLCIYINSNGLEFSVEKTSMILFNSGSSSKLPIFTLDDCYIQYKTSVKFLGVLLTSKLSWNTYIECINQARKKLNLLKIVNKQKWCQNTTVMIHLAKALVRSKLTYGQEVYFYINFRVLIQDL